MTGRTTSTRSRVPAYDPGRGSRARRSPLAPLWLAAALVVFALVSLTVGVIAKHNTLAPGLYPPSYLKLFFSDPIHLKVWLATAAVCSPASRSSPPPTSTQRLRLPMGAGVAAVHRWSGRLAILLTLPVAYHCIFLLGYGDYSTRVQVHSLLGSVIYGAFIAKVLVVRGGTRFPGWVLPLAGGTLFAILLGLWLTSSLWFFQNVGVGI